MTRVLVITEAPTRRHRIVTLGERSTLLTRSSWRLLRLLAEARRREPGAWSEPMTSNGARQRVHRLRTQLQELDPEAHWWIQNGYEGYYRLAAAAPEVREG